MPYNDIGKVIVTGSHLMQTAADFSAIILNFLTLTHAYMIHRGQHSTYFQFTDKETESKL